MYYILVIIKTYREILRNYINKMKSKRVSSNKRGTIYKLETPLIFINNTKTIFGIENYKCGEYKLEY